MAVILQFGLASGIVLLNLGRGFGVNIDSLLFGSILLVETTQIFMTRVVLALILGVVFAFYKEMQYATFDEAQARGAGINTSLFDYLISILSGIVVIARVPWPDTHTQLQEDNFRNETKGAATVYCMIHCM